MLKEKRKVIIQVEGDGNCLFRSVSHQIYGTQKYHMELRQACMDYVTVERHFFQGFISAKFEDYIEHKRQSGIWGDDVEIQAMSEIYDRPVEIFAYRVNPMRTFHEDKEKKREPISLSYHGYSHYNSIKDLGKEAIGLQKGEQEFGVIEKQAIEKALERQKP